MLLENIKNGPQCNSISMDLHHLIIVEAESPQPQELLHRLNKQNSELKSVEVLDSQRNGLNKSPSLECLNNLEKEKFVVCDDKAILESKYKDKVAENEQLRAAVYNLEYQLQDIHRDCSAQLSMCHSQIEQKQALIDNLSGDVRDLQDQTESLQERLVEDERLKEALDELEKEDGALRKQIKNMTDELTYYESLAEKQGSDNMNLKTDKQDLQSQLSEAQYVISNRREIIVRQKKEISSNKELIEELQNQTREMQETICDLQHQAEQRKEEEIVDYVQDFEEENPISAESSDQSDPEELGEDSLKEFPAISVQAVELPEEPKEELPKQGFGSSFTRGLLVGMVFWFFTVGVLGSWNILSAVTYSYCDNPVECFSDCIFQLFDPYNSHNKNLRPF